MYSFPLLLVVFAYYHYCGEQDFLPIPSPAGWRHPKFIQIIQNLTSDGKTPTPLAYICSHAWCTFPSHFRQIIIDLNINLSEYFEMLFPHSLGLAPRQTILLQITWFRHFFWRLKNRNVDCMLSHSSGIMRWRWIQMGIQCLVLVHIYVQTYPKFSGTLPHFPFVRFFIIENNFIREMYISKHKQVQDLQVSWDTTGFRGTSCQFSHNAHTTQIPTDEYLVNLWEKLPWKSNIYFLLFKTFF